MRVVKPQGVWPAFEVRATVARTCRNASCAVACGAEISRARPWRKAPPRGRSPRTTFPGGAENSATRLPEIALGGARPAEPVTRNRRSKGIAPRGVDHKDLDRRLLLLDRRENAIDVDPVAADVGLAPDRGIHRQKIRVATGLQAETGKVQEDGGAGLDLLFEFVKRPLPSWPGSYPRRAARRSRPRAGHRRWSWRPPPAHRAGFRYRDRIVPDHEGQSRALADGGRRGMTDRRRGRRQSNAGGHAACSQHAANTSQIPHRPMHSRENRQHLLLLARPTCRQGGAMKNRSAVLFRSMISSSLFWVRGRQSVGGIARRERFQTARQVARLVAGPG